MIIKVVLILFLAVIVLHAVTSMTIRRGHKVIAVVVAAVGVTAVLDSEMTNVVAAELGVGRGADLLGYLTTLLILYVGVTFYAKIKQLERQIEIITRQFAVMTASEPGRPGR